MLKLFLSNNPPPTPRSTNIFYVSAKKDITDTQRMSRCTTIVRMAYQHLRSVPQTLCSMVWMPVLTKLLKNTRLLNVQNLRESSESSVLWVTNTTSAFAIDRGWGHALNTITSMVDNVFIWGLVQRDKNSGVPQIMEYMLIKGMTAFSGCAVIGCPQKAYVLPINADVLRLGARFLVL